MVENLPVPNNVPPDVWLTALARAAAEMAAHEGARRRELEPLDREAIEVIAKECAEAVIKEVFETLDVDLDDKDARRDFRDDLRHARRMRAWWDKAGASLYTALTTLLAGGLIAAVIKYLSIGGAK